MKRKFMITGAAGFLGSNLVKRLLQEQDKVRVLLLPNEVIKGVPNDKLEVVYGDVTDLESLKPFFEKENNTEQICIHCAGIITISNKNGNNVYNVNVNGTKNIIKMCLKNHIDKLIYVSSVHAIKELPKDEIITETNDFSPNYVDGLYAKTKAEATACALDAAKEGLNAIVVHPSGIIGPYDYSKGNTTSLFIAHGNGKLPAIVKGGYDFVDVRDVCEGIVSAVDHGRKGECYILSNKYITIKDMINITSEFVNQKQKKTVLPNWFIKPLAPLAELYYSSRKEKPLFTAYSLRVLESNGNFSHEKATNELNYHPRPITRTLKDTISWLKDEGYIKE